MLATLIAVGVFSNDRYETPLARTIEVPGISVGCRHSASACLPEKLADEVVDFRLDWSRSLLGDVISTATVEATSGDILPSRLIFDQVTTSLFVSGGTTGSQTILKCKIVTAVGRLFEFFLQISVR